MGRRGRVKFRDLSPHDQREVRLFRKFLKAAATTSQTEAYATVYSEQIYPQPPKHKRSR